MGWVHDDYNSDHEGHVVAVLPDGTSAPADVWEDGEAADARDLTWAWSLKYDGADGRPRAAGIRTVCACGWEGPRRPADPTDPEAAEAGLYEQWLHHAEVALSRTLPEEIQRLVNELEEAVTGFCAAPTEGRPEDSRPLVALYAATLLRQDSERWQQLAVQAAKKDYSWEEIARPLGTSKQAAWERFRDLP
ncbi:hypothetical protein [Streptomyces sp. Ac-502]|uniref:hypothetical protein n=1 Tax=Streptomyces sp. Ac-502 TaxID=3342801 RepID=UPI0038624D91